MQRLEIVAAWDKHHVIDRLMGNDVWENPWVDLKILMNKYF